METSKIGQHLPIKIFPSKMLPKEASLPPLHYQHDTLNDIIKSLRHPEKQNRLNNLNYICFPGFYAISKHYLILPLQGTVKNGH
jgi:hypothetical protein